MRVGFIGLGSQGAPMARRIVDAGYPTTLWARRPASLEPFAGTAATVSDTPAELAADCDLVCLCVLGDADVREITTGEHGVLEGLESGGVLAVHSTVHPATCQEIGAIASARGVSVVDAPVSGGGAAAAQGRLLVMVGGESDTVERCRPVFETYGEPVVHLGDLGSGQVTKLLNNLLFTANLATAAATLTLGEALGVARDGLGGVITHGSANSFALNTILDSGGTLDTLGAHAATLLQKDVRLIADLAVIAAVGGGAVLAAADAALAVLEHPR